MNRRQMMMGTAAAVFGGGLAACADLGEAPLPIMLYDEVEFMGVSLIVTNEVIDQPVVDNAANWSVKILLEDTPH